MSLRNCPHDEGMRITVTNLFCPLCLAAEVQWWETECERLHAIIERYKQLERMMKLKR